MDKPQPKETKGVPWADHNETESTPPDTRRERYGDAESGQTPDEQAADRKSDPDLLESEEERQSRIDDL
jgi:hypothetical protein